MKHAFGIVGVLLSVLMAGASPASGKGRFGNPLVPKQFLTKDASGRVLVWQPWSSAWRQVKKGDRLWEDALVQVGNGSQFTFSIESSEGFQGLKADAIDITINSPMLLRLRPDVPRRVQLGDFFIPKLPDATVDPDAKPEDLAHLLEDAWFRFAANVLPQALKDNFLGAAAREEQDTTMSVRAKRLKIYTPSRDAIYITDRFPYRVRVAWERVPTTSEYGVRLWPWDQLRPPPLAYTEQDHYSVLVEEEGNYLVQVTTRDGRYQSEVKRFQVLLPMSGRGRPPSLTEIRRPLPLQAPPAEFVYLTHSFPAPVSFQWDRPVGSKGKFLYNFQLLDPKGQPLFSRQTDRTQMTVRFNDPGEYRWTVTATPDNRGSRAPASTNVTYSEARRLVLRRAPLPARQLDELLALAASVRGSGVLYLEEPPRAGKP